jgi:hypothetical protein
MKVGWIIADTYTSEKQKSYLYRHVGRSFWDIVWILENHAGTATSGGTKDSAYYCKQAGFDFYNSKPYTPEPRDFHNAIRAVFGEL